MTIKNRKHILQDDNLNQTNVQIVKYKRDNGTHSISWHAFFADRKTKLCTQSLRALIKISCIRKQLI